MPKKNPKPDPQPPTPPYLRGDDKRSTILRAAHKLLLRDGFSVTSMDAVTQEAGVSKATVYAHFDSKQNLFETLIRLGSENALKAVPSLDRRGGDPRSELLAFFEPLLALVFSGGYAWSRVLIAEAQRHPDLAEVFYRCTIERLTMMVEQYLAGLVQEGVVQVGDVHRAAEALLAMVLLGPLHRVLLLGPHAVDVQAALHSGIDVLLQSAVPGSSSGLG